MIKHSEDCDCRLKQLDEIDAYLGNCPIPIAAKSGIWTGVNLWPYEQWEHLRDMSGYEIGEALERIYLDEIRKIVD